MIIFGIENITHGTLSSDSKMSVKRRFCPTHFPKVDMMLTNFAQLNNFDCAISFAFRRHAYYESPI